MKSLSILIFLVGLSGCLSAIKGVDDPDVSLSEHCSGFIESNPEYWNVLSGSEPENEDIWRSLNQKYKNKKGRSLIVFIDGTGNTSLSNTNIWKLYSLAVKNSCDQPIIPYYHKGIGTKTLNKILGGGLGSGLDRLIRDGYQFLVETYQPGDKIFIFGFSRGAYAARSLNGMVDFVGLLDINNMGSTDSAEKNSLETTVKELYNIYSVYNDGKYQFEKRLRRDISNSDLVKSLPIYGKDSERVTVSAIGVFDTVAALGIGRDDFPDNHRTDLYALEGYHALSIDEQRNDFRPLFFNQNTWGNQSLKKVWFAGAHADVGGGYSDHHGLELLSRQWMLEQFSKFELFSNTYNEFDYCKSDTATCTSGTLHDEFLDQKLFGKFGIHWRAIAKDETIHRSVLCRWKIVRLPMPNTGREPDNQYRPENFFISLEQMNIEDPSVCRS